MYIYIYSLTVVLGEKIKNFLIFTTVFLGEKNKELFFHDFWGGEKI